MQIVEWYDELVRLTDSPVARLNRAVAVGEADGPRAGLAALAETRFRSASHTAVAAYLHERDGDPVTAARLYAEAAQSASNLPERDHLTRPGCATERGTAQLDDHGEPESWPLTRTRAGFTGTKERRAAGQLGSPP